MKYLKQAFLLTIGICLTSILFAQSTANGSVPAKPVSNSTAGTPVLSTAKPVPVDPSNSKKVKTVDKKKRKPSQVTTVKKAPRSVK